MALISPMVPMEKIVFDQKIAGLGVALRHPLKGVAFLLGVERLGERTGSGRDAEHEKQRIGEQKQR